MLCRLHLHVLQGLEVEVQRLINRHRADLEAAHERAAEQVQQALDAAKVDHDAQLQALKERLKQVSWPSAVCAYAYACACHGAYMLASLGSAITTIHKLPTSYRASEPCSVSRCRIVEGAAKATCEMLCTAGATAPRPS